MKMMKNFVFHYHYLRMSLIWSGWLVGGTSVGRFQLIVDILHGFHDDDCWRKLLLMRILLILLILFVIVVIVAVAVAEKCKRQKVQ